MSVIMSIYVFVSYYGSDRNVHDMILHAEVTSATLKTPSPLANMHQYWVMILWFLRHWSDTDQSVKHGRAHTKVAQEVLSSNWRANNTGDSRAKQTMDTTPWCCGSWWRCVVSQVAIRHKLCCCCGCCCWAHHGMLKIQRAYTLTHVTTSLPSAWVYLL